MRTIIFYLNVYIFNIIGNRKYVIKKIIYNICNTIPLAGYQQWLITKTKVPEARD